MMHSYSRASLILGTSLLLSPLGAFAQAPLITGITPLANAVAAPRTAPLTVSFSQPLTAASAGALKVFSSQRGGLRSLSTPASVSGNTLSFAPTAYPWMPGETVNYTVTAAAGGGTTGQTRVGQFTTAVGGTGRGYFGGGSDPSLPSGYLTNAAMGDLDGDGDLDMVTPNSYFGTFASIGINSGGTFTNTSTVLVGYSPQAIVLGDIDGDGDLDLITANGSDSFANPTYTASVRVNNGSGSFNGNQEVSIGNNPTGLTLCDVDGDGDQDLLVTSEDVVGAVSIRLNNGNGIFTGTQSIPVSSYPHSIVTGDIDNDGDLDLLVGFGNGSLDVRFNNGSGVFTGVNTGSGGTPSRGNYDDVIASGDIDGDGDIDCLVANITYLNNGSGTFSPHQTIGIGTISSLAIGDIDGDRDLDYVTVSGYLGTTASIWLNDGSGSFSSFQNIIVTPDPKGVSLGDIDGDGDLDLLATSGNAIGTVSIRLNNSVTSSISSAYPVSSLTLAPNPTTSLATLTGTLPHAPVDVFDALGRGILNTRADASGTARLALPDGLPAGVYLVRSAGLVRRLAVE